MTLRQQRLLVADSQEADCSELAGQLRDLGYDITCVPSSRKVLAHLDADRFDLLLLHIDLEGSSTCQILERIRSDSRQRDIPVIVISDTINPERITKCIEWGADDYMLQPFSPALLQARLSVVIERRRLQRAQQEECEKAQMLATELQEVILPVGISLSAETDFDRMLERILIEAKSVANADAGTLYLRTEENTLEFAIVLTDSLGVALGGTTRRPISFKPLPLFNEAGEPNLHNVATYVANTGRSVKVADVYETEHFDFSGTKVFDQMNGYRTRSVLTVPLKNNKDDVIGVLQLINSQDAETGAVSEFDFYEQLVIETLASQAAVALNNQMVTRRQTELLKLERDVQVGHAIQSDFLPKKEALPQVPGWEIAARLYPARQVAGDFYDTFEMSNDRIGFLIADVCDKGVGAALFMALMRSLLRAFAQQHYSTDLAGRIEALGTAADTGLEVMPTAGVLALENAVQLTNDYVATNHAALSMFATMFFGVLNPETGSVTYINGGHNAPMIIDADGVIRERLKPTGPAVGMFAGSKFVLQKTRLHPGEMLVCFTDGVPDARNPDGGFFGEERLIELLCNPTSSAWALLERLEKSLYTHISTADQFDDITLMVLRRDGAE